MPVTGDPVIPSGLGNSSKFKNAAAALAHIMFVLLAGCHPGSRPEKGSDPATGRVYYPEYRQCQWA
jgi:hypothetical protein